MCVETAVSLANMVNLTDVETEIIHVKGFLVPEIRSKGVALAWEAKATHILWVDSDMGFPPWALNQLLEAELDIIGVNYRCIRKPTRKVFKKFATWAWV